MTSLKIVRLALQMKKLVTPDLPVPRLYFSDIIEFIVSVIQLLM